ncbi:MAG: GNAT family N-acetyltransferase [Chitinophagaceae bacterium]|nr:GNAT family N-acetyltransferase [Chitinophagaceae bacterium]
MYIITNASLTDLPLIYQLFDEAIAFQKENNFIGWQTYDKAFIQDDINKGLLYKIVAENNIVGIFTVYYSDLLIWRQMEKQDAIYLHRIVLNRKFKNIKIFKEVLDWATRQCHRLHLKYIRMDTWAGNAKLIAYYQSFGFRFIENFTTSATEKLPLQHRNLNVALLQFKL